MTKRRREKLAVNISRDMHAIMLAKKRETGRSLESLYEEVIAAGLRIKRWIPAELEHATA